jgi:hypothetical protein
MNDRIAHRNIADAVTLLQAAAVGAARAPDVGGRDSVPVRETSSSRRLTGMPRYSFKNVCKQTQIAGSERINYAAASAVVARLQAIQL